MEASAHLIAHAAAGHRRQRRVDHRPRRAGAGVLPQQEEQVRRTRELRRVAEPTPLRVERLLIVLDRRIEQRGARHWARCDLAPAQGREPRHDAIGRLGHPIAFDRPGSRHLAQDINETGPTPSRERRKVGAAVERLQRRREPDAHRPAAATGRGLHESHVDTVDVGPLLAVDLDRDEPAVQDVGDLGVLERLALHHVAPVTGRVADREEDRLVLLPGSRERLVTPRIPVHGIRGVLQQVGTRLVGQAVRHQ